MKKFKVILDRKPMNSDHVESKQDFNHVLNEFKKLKPPIWRNPWFYGPVGLASLTLLMSIGIVNSKEIANDNKSTKESSVILPEDTKCFHPIKQSLVEQFTTYSIDPSVEQTINLPSGTSIFIPKGSLISSSPEKKVEIKIREFNDKASAFIAGIPMDYQKNSAFESAGMIELRGGATGEEIKISPSKPIEVSMVLRKDPSSFTFWKFEENKKEWINYPAIFNAENNSFLDNSKELTQIKKELVETTAKITANDVSCSKIIEPTRIEKFLPIEGNQRFDLAFDKNEFPELEKFIGMEFEVNSKKKYDKSFTKKIWSDVDLVKENDNYYASFSSKTEKFKIGVRPVLNGVKKEEAEINLSKSIAFCQNKKQELEIEKKKLIFEKLQQESKLKTLVDNPSETLLVNAMRREENSEGKTNRFAASFQMVTFGIFNCDHPIEYPLAYKEEVGFSFYGTIADIKSAYVFDNDQDLCFSFGSNTSRDLDKFGCFEKNSNTLFVLDSNGRMGYVLNYTSKDIKNGFIKVTLIDKKDENIEFIHNLINENAINS